MPLLLQLNGDLPDRFSGHERRLYVFGCKGRRCRRREGSVRALRGLKVWGNHQGGAQRIKDLDTHGDIGHTGASIRESQIQEPARLGDSIFSSTKDSQSSAWEANGNPFSTKSASQATGPVNPFSAPSQAANPFSVGAQESPSAKPSVTPTVESDLSTTFAQKARLSAPQPSSAGLLPSPPPAAPEPEEPWPTSPATPPYPASHLDAAYETLDPLPSSSESPQTSKLSATPNSASFAGTANAEVVDDGKDGVEMNMDGTFQKFADRVAQNPEQVLRYEFAGQPLLYHKDDRVGRMMMAVGSGSGPGSGARVSTATTASIAGRLQASAPDGGGVGGGGSGLPRCGHCGSARVFELQLMPHAIAELEREEEGLDGMEWGTVVVGVCAADCADDEEGEGKSKISWREEWVGVQWEEEVKRK